MAMVDLNSSGSPAMGGNPAFNDPDFIAYVQSHPEMLSQNDPMSLYRNWQNSGKVVGTINNSSDLIDKAGSTVGSSAKDSFSANDALIDLYNQTNNLGFLEQYIQNIIERENTSSARQYETEMSNTAFSRLVADIQNAGFNPWIALQGNMQTASTPNVSSARSSNVSGASLATSKYNTQQSNTTDIITRVIGALGVAFGAILMASGKKPSSIHLHR